MNPGELSYEDHLAEQTRRVAPGLAELPDWLEQRFRSTTGVGYFETGEGQLRYHAETLLEHCQVVHRAGCKDVDDLVQACLHQDEQVREAAYSLLQKFGVRKAAPLLVRLFLERPHERQEIGQVLSYLDSKLARAQLVTWMTDHPDPDLRYEATYVLTWDKHHSLAAPMLDVLSNRSEEDRIRLQALEALGYLLRYRDRRSRFYNHFAEAVAAYLRDPDPAYRFWAAFAVGQANYRKAIPILEEMAANDHAEYPGWWSVSKEAQKMLDTMNRH